jgi:hypothetical protein
MRRRLSTFPFIFIEVFYREPAPLLTLGHLTETSPEPGHSTSARQLIPVTCTVALTLDTGHHFM